MNWNEVLQALNTAALAAFVLLFVLGYIVSMKVVREQMIAPLTDRISALERISAKRDDQYAELQRQQAEAIAAQGRAMEILLAAVDAQGRRSP